MRDLDELTAIARTAVQLGHDILTSSTPARVHAKRDRDFVTDVDVTIEQEIRHHLSQATPEIGFLGEEEGRHAQADQMWVLDPIDGTTNYVHGLPMYAVSLALLGRYGTLVGIIDAPALGYQYEATTGHGARRNGEPIQCSTTTELTRSVIAIGDYAVGPHAAEKNNRRLRLTAELAARVERVRMLGTAALDLAFVADGRLDGSVTLSNKPWDTIAGTLIAREAGALVADATGTPHTTHSVETIAISPAIADAFLLLVQGA